MKELKYYDEELDYYFVVQVTTPAGICYAYNHRTLVRDMSFARCFETRRSAQRCIRRSAFDDCKILRLRRSRGMGREQAQQL